MEDSDVENMHTDSLATQFVKIQTTTDKSHVMKYGQETFTNEPIGNFQGNYNDPAIKPKTESFFDRLVLKARKQASVIPSDFDKHMSAVHSRDSKLHHLYSTL